MKLKETDELSCIEGQGTMSVESFEEAVSEMVSQQLLDLQVVSASNVPSKQYSSLGNNAEVYIHIYVYIM